MIALFYSNKQPDKISIPSESLGGYIACNQVPNGEEGALFSNTLIAQIDNRETRAFFVKNIGTETVIKPLLFALYESEYASYEAAVVVPNSKGVIERLNDSNGLPSIGTFFNIQSNFAIATIEILKGSKKNETLIIEGENIVFSKKLTPNQVRERIFEVLQHNTSIYTIQRVEKTKIKFTYNRIGNYEDDIEWSTNGTIDIDTSSFSGGVDNSILLAEKLDPGEMIGVWLKKKYLSYKQSCDELYQAFKEKNQSLLERGRTGETIVFSRNEQFNLMITYSYE